MDKRIAMLIDLDNFVGFCLELGLPIDVKPIVEKLSEIGRVSFLYSFGDIYKFPVADSKKQEIRKMLQENLVKHEDVRYRSQYKNSSDIRLVIEALSIAYTYSDVDTFAIVAQDRDYIALFSKLREIGRRVVGFGGNDSAHDDYRSACDHFYSYELLFATNRQVLESLQNGFTLLVKSMKAVSAGGHEEIKVERVIYMMRHFRSDFDVRNYGLTTFKEFFQKAKETNIIDINPYPQVPGSILSFAENEGRVAPAQSEEEGDLVKRYKLWVENKIKLALPSAETRATVYAQIKNVLAQEDHAGTQLQDLVKMIVRAENVEQTQVFKILFSLFMARTFYCEQDIDNHYNPLILRFSNNAEENLDYNYIRSFLFSYKKENYHHDLDCAAWSQCFFGDEEHRDFIDGIIKSLSY